MPLRRAGGRFTVSVVRRIRRRSRHYQTACCPPGAPGERGRGGGATRLIYSDADRQQKSKAAARRNAAGSKRRLTLSQGTFDTAWMNRSCPVCTWNDWRKDKNLKTSQTARKRHSKALMNQNVLLGCDPLIPQSHGDIPSIPIICCVEFGSFPGLVWHKELLQLATAQIG